MNTGRLTAEECRAWERYQALCAAMELTWIQIQMLDVTTDCPDEEKLDV